MIATFESYPHRRASDHQRIRKIVGIVLLVWLSGSIIGAASVWYITERQNREFSHDHNALICVFRSIVLPNRARSVQTARDATQSPSARARARAAVKTDDQLLHSLISIPRSFDCSKFKP